MKLVCRRTAALVRGAQCAGRRYGPGLLGFARRRRDERGGVIAVFAATMGAGAVIGMGALVIDVGQIYAEREELQSGADAAASAVAELCVADPFACADDTRRDEWAQDYANNNAKDLVSDVSLVCGTAPGLEDCPPQGTGLTDCIGPRPSDSTRYVEVHTATELPDGRWVLPPSFALALAGNGDYEGSTIVACARAAYGPPYRSGGLALTLSYCEWKNMTDSGTNLAPPPQVAVPPTNAEGVIYLHDPHDEDAVGCENHKGTDAPGGFGWLDQDASGTCNAVVTAGGTIDANPGNDTPAGCAQLLASKRAARSVLLMPVFESVVGTGNNTSYTIMGFSAFVLTGYQLTGGSAESWLSKRHLCSGAERCLYGYFTRAIVAGPGGLGEHDLGSVVVTLIG